MAEKRILIVDIGSDYQKDVSELVKLLEEKGIKVDRPNCLKDFARLIGISQNGWLKGIPPIIFNLHFESRFPVRETLRVAEAVGIRVLNSSKAVNLCQDRLSMLNFLRKGGIAIPEFYFGHPLGIPEDFGSQVVIKNPKGHLVMKIERGKIHSLEEVIYCEKIIDNPTDYIVTVYCIFGNIFSARKFDSLKTERRGKEVIKTDLVHRDIIEKIGRMTGLEFFGVDFIGNVVIDVNPFPNFFFYKPVFEVVVEYFLNI